MIRIWFVKFGAIRVIFALKIKNPLAFSLGSGLSGDTNATMMVFT
jgi:hypothetical protein